MKHIMKILGILPILAGNSLGMETLKYDNPSNNQTSWEHKPNIEDNIFLAVERAEGKKEGIEIGKVEEKRKIALKMLLKGMSEKDIMTLTELSMAEIEELKKQQ